MNKFIALGFAAFLGLSVVGCAPKEAAPPVTPATTPAAEGTTPAAEGTTPAAEGTSSAEGA